MPVIAAVGAVLFLDGTPTARLVFCGAAVLGGVGLALSARFARLLGSERTEPFMTDRLGNARTSASPSCRRPIRVLLGNLLTCGALAGPLYVTLGLLQILFREGFDIRRHALSLMSNGEALAGFRSPTSC